MRGFHRDFGCAVIAAWLLGSATGAQPRGAKPTRIDALVGARVVVAPGRVIEHGTIVLRDGIIDRVSADAEVPPGAAGVPPGAVGVPPEATVWESEGLTVYAGFIEPFAEVSAPAREAGAAAPLPGPSYPNPLIHPELDASSLPQNPSAREKLRAAGFTSALVVPADGLWRGQAAVVNTGDGDARENLLRRNVAQGAYLATHGEYPGSLMGSVALLRQSLLDAQWYQKAHASYARNPAQPRPPADVSLEALQPVLEGKTPVLFESRDALDVLRIARVASEFALRPWIVGSGTEYRYLDQIAALGLPLILPVGFPEPPEVKPEPNDNLDVSLERLVHWDLAPGTPKALLDRGARLAFTTSGLDSPAAIFGKLARAIERGLTEEQALSALTVDPARLLGIERVAGTIETGKMANLVVVEGPLFADQPKLRAVFVDGRRYEGKESKPPAIEPAGTWQVTIETDGPTIEVTLELRGLAGQLTGSMSALGQNLPLQSAEVSGKELELRLDSTPMGQPGVIEMNVTVEGESFSGSGTSPMGPFRVRGSRVARPGGGVP